MQDTIVPKKLKKGDTVGIVSPSKHLDEEGIFKLKRAMKQIESFGLKVIIGKNALKIDKYGYSAGSPQERAEDINNMFGDMSISAIWCSQGGHTANSILDLLDYELIQKYPKIFIGLSDITVLLNAINQKTGLITFHGPDPRGYPQDETFATQYAHEEFVNRLMKAEIGQIRKISQWKIIRNGSCKGILVGGNLHSLLKLAGTPHFPDVKNKILLLEGYQIDIPNAYYMIIQLQQMKIFQNISAIVVGYVYGFQHEKRKIQFEDILLDLTKEYNFPILKINEFGHKCHNTILPIGGMAKLDLEKQIFAITSNCVL